MPVSHIESAQPLASALHLLGARVGGEVEVVAEATQQGIAYGTPDQVERVPGVGEPPAEVVGDRRDAQQLGEGSTLRLAQRVVGRASGGGHQVIRSGSGHGVQAYGLGRGHASR